MAACHHHGTPDPTKNRLDFVDDARDDSGYTTADREKAQGLSKGRSAHSPGPASFATQVLLI
jgi:hypothetical protein